MAREIVHVILILLYCKWASSLDGGNGICVVENFNISHYEDWCDYRSCRNISFLQLNEEIQNNTYNSVYLCIVQGTTLDIIVTFRNKTEVTVIGMGSNISIITCSNKTTGFKFTNVNFVRIAGISMDQCGGFIEEKDSSALTLTSIYSANLHDLALINSKSTGLANFNVTNLLAFSLKILKSKGQGMTIFGFREQNITLINSSFTSNNYYYQLKHHRNRKLKDGGGIYANFHSNTSVVFKVTKTIFVDNQAGQGGGIAIVEETTTHYHHVSSINVLFKDCRFLRNTAAKGGGLYLFLVRIKPINSENPWIKFVRTNWERNIGLHGSAVMIEPCVKCLKLKYPKLLPSFDSCNFHGNKAIMFNSISNTSNYKLYRRPKGTLYIREIGITLQGATAFFSNEASAIYAISSNLHIASQSLLNFSSNTGYRGGAIALYSTSKLLVENNIMVNFEYNQAAHKGGAIYQKAFNFEEDTRFQCFIRNIGTDSDSKHFIFNNNQAGQTGDTLYLTTLSGCNNNQSFKNCSGILHDYAHFYFSECKPTEIETMGNAYKVHDNSPIKHVIPGKPTDLGISIIDDTGKPIYTVIKAVVAEIQSAVKIDSAYTYITNNKIVLLGEESAEATVTLNLLNYENFLLKIKVVLQKCPPGLTSYKQECVCSANHVNVAFYDGIDMCDMEEFKAHLQNSYWAGYFDNDSTAEFRTNICPIEFCDRSPNNYTGAWLPLSTDTSELSEAVCSAHKVGVLCGRCVANHSVYFHDASFSCKENKRCEWGLPLYLVSELLPATIFFTLVISLDITFTSGHVSGFIFYVQIFDSLLISGNHATWFNGFSGTLLKVLNFIVRMFNLRFFSLNELSFCLIKGADALDMIAFQYFTLIYCFFLIVVTIALKNKCSIKLNLYFGLKKTQLSDSIIHGLSSFLVICYFQGTKISFLLLSFVTIGQKTSENRVFYNGDIVFLGDEHIKYAIPAILFLIFITIIPPLLLLSYPLCYKVLAFCNLQESKFTQFLCKCIPLEKYKPLFDSFQSTFKDEHRYFSGLHFVFRCFILVLILLHKDLMNSYVILDLLFLAMLTLHATQRPYRNDKHNTLDNLIYSLLIVLNTISLFNYHRRKTHSSEADLVPYTSFIQVLLAWIPLVCMMVFLCHRSLRVISKVYVSKRKTKNDVYDLTSSIMGMEEERDNMVEIGYGKYSAT